jgi:hypothetical protein
MWRFKNINSEKALGEAYECAKITKEVQLKRGAEDCKRWLKRIWLTSFFF